MTAAAAHAFPPRPLRAMAGRALESALNRAVALDPDTATRLAALEGRRLELHLRGPELRLSIHVEGGILRVGPPDDEAIAATALCVAATPASLLAMGLRRDDDSVAPGKVEIAGDAELARRLEKLARNYAPDVEEVFANVFGDVLGVPLARAVRGALEHAREGAQHTVEDVADWLREESRLAVAPAEMDGFLDDVDHLRERAERLGARLARIERQRAERDA